MRTFLIGPTLYNMLILAHLRRHCACPRMKPSSCDIILPSDKHLHQWSILLPAQLESCFSSVKQDIAFKLHHSILIQTVDIILPRSQLFRPASFSVQELIENN